MHLCSCGSLPVADLKPTASREATQTLPAVVELYLHAESALVTEAEDKAMHQQLEISQTIPPVMPAIARVQEQVLPPFWLIQAAGWGSFFGVVLLATIPELNKPGTVREDVLTVLFMFFGSCVLRPLCRYLQGSSLTWLRLEASVLAWCLFVGPLASGVAILVMNLFRPMSWGEWIVVSVQFVVVLFLWCSLYFNAKYWQAVIHGEGRRRTNTYPR